MSDQHSEYPKTIAAPLPSVPERLIQRRSKEEKLLGAYALAIANGEVDGLIGSDIFPDDGESF